LIHIQYPHDQTVPSLPVSVLYAYPEMNKYCLKDTIIIHEENSGAKNRQKSLG
jgi:hypothetical protein